MQYGFVRALVAAPAHEVIPVSEDDTGRPLLHPVLAVAPEVVAIGVVDFHLKKIIMELTVCLC